MDAAALALAVALAAGAAGGVVGERHFGPFSIYADAPALIYLDGDIEFDAADQFARARQAAPAAATLVLMSDGGNVEAARTVAREVRDLGLDTYVPRRHGCYSACAFIFFAGENRRATGQLGVHQVSDPAFTAPSLQRSLADLLDLLYELGVDQRVVSAMLRTPPEALYILDRRETAELGVDREPTRSLDWLDERFGHPFDRWNGAAADSCEPILPWSGDYEGCVSGTWIPTPPAGGETYYYQDAGHRMGLLITDDPYGWTRDELREIVRDAALSESGDGVLQELQWPVAGTTFDLMIYTGVRNGSDVLYQHFYHARPGGGALEVLVYSAAGQAWQASILAAQFLGHLRFKAGAP